MPPAAGVDLRGFSSQRFRQMSFRQPVDIDAINAHARGSLVENLGIVITEAGTDWLRGTMPVDARTVQPYGILHGGASVALAETLGSIAGNLCVDTSKQRVVGLEINANHLRAMSHGTVTGTARALHVGRSTHVWEIRIENDAGQPVCISRLTLAVVAVA
jgi:1,4-dihydroxy-2-naphthoyl-CoA hydrolase